MQQTQFPEYVRILSGSLASRKLRNPRYSLRAFARHLGVDPSSMSRILSGKQEMSVFTCRRMLQRLGLADAERERFMASVADAKARRARRELAPDAGMATGSDGARVSRPSFDADGLVKTVAHDMRGPLTAIINCAELLGRVAAGRDEEPAFRRSVDCIRTASERLLHLVDGLIGGGCPEGTVPELQYSSHGVQALMETAVSLARPLADPKGIRILVEAAGGDFEARCDRDQVLRVLSNLIGNAVKFSPEGAEITVQAFMEGGNARFSVRDRGCGIAGHDAPFVFEPHWQARPGDGVGLGLSIAREVVRSHGGEIWFESAPSQGAVFHFTLPLPVARPLQVA